MGWFDTITETVSNVTNTVTETVSNATNAVTETVIAVDKITLGPETREFEREILNEGINVVQEVDKITLGPETREFERTFIDKLSHQLIKDAGGFVEEGKKSFDSTSDIIGKSIGSSVSKVEEELYEEEKIIEETITGTIRKGSDIVKNIGGQISNVGGLIENETQKVFWDYLGNPLVIGAGIVGLILLV